MNLPVFSKNVSNNRVARVSAMFVVCIVSAIQPVYSQSVEQSLQPTADSTSESSANQTLATQVNALFGLRASMLVNLDLPLSPEDGVEVVIPVVDGETFTVFASPHSILTPSCKVYVQIEDGSFIEQLPEAPRTLRGVVAEYPDSVVAGSLLETGLAATILLPDGRRYWIEPVASKMAVVDRSLHVVYLNDDAIKSGGSCATDTPAPVGEPGGDDGSPRGAACGTGLCFAELATDADFEYFQQWGSVTAVQNRINLVINTMNTQYDNQVDITHVISAMVIRTTNATDPYTSTDSLGLVTQFRNEWINNFPSVPRDLAHLFTGKEIDGSVIGRAFGIGIVCTNQAYSFAQSDCCGSIACSTDLSAHENGHVWAGFHCDPCGGTTMQSSLQCANTFAAVNINQISAHRDSRTCLATSGALVPPFTDDFPSTTIDTAKWSIVSGAQINTVGTNEPSAPNSLNIDGNDSITSQSINLSVANNGAIAYQWQRTGGGDSPEDNENLLVEYLNNVNVWTLLASHPGAGSDVLPFASASFPVPADAKHAFFRLRFRGSSTATNGTDDFFVDDVNIDPGDISPPSPSPSTFLVLPMPNPANPLSEIYMEATIATDPTGPVQYFFQRTNGTPTDSGWINTNVWIGPGPVPNSPWTFRVKTRDAAPTPNESAYSVPSAAYTAIETPTGISSANLLGDRFDLTALGSFTALNSLQSGLFFEVKNAQGDPVGTGANEWTSNSLSTTRTITGLSPSTQYTVRVKARNRPGVETEFTTAVNVSTTDLIVPGAPILGNATDATMTLTINTNGNFPSTEYAIQCIGTSPADLDWASQYANHATGLPQPTEHWQTAGSPITINGLTPSTQYTFRVKARNPTLQETAFGPNAALTTSSLFTPGAPVLSNPTINSMQLAISTNGNPPTMQYAIQCTGTLPTDLGWQNQYVNHATGAPNGPAEDWQIAGSPITLLSLNPNVQYTFAVKGRNASATFVSPFGPSASLAALALPPGQPVIGQYPLTTAALDVVPSDHPTLFNTADTEFAIRCISSDPADASWTNQFVGFAGNPTAAEVWQTNSDWGFVAIQGLQLSNEYAFAVKARNRNGVETAFGPSAVFTTGTDCNVNNIADAQEAAECTGQPACDDCNDNGLLDACEVGFDVAQWAASVIDFSSEYDVSPAGYSAAQALGAPNVPVYGDNQLAWTPVEPNEGLQFITVGYSIEVHADGAVVRESLSNGFVAKLEVVKVDNTLVEVWPLATGETDNSPPNVLADFAVSWPETPYLVKGLRVTIDTTQDLDNWEEIDAIQLLGRVPATTPDTNSNGIPDSCESVATGACCVDSACEISTEAACGANDGIYQGNNSTCSPTPCTPTCVLAGDMNGDALIDASDIAGYTRAKLGVAPEPGENPACADFGTNNLDQDTAEFVDALIGV